jgi:hypothetical protein
VTGVQNMDTETDTMGIRAFRDSTAFWLSFALGRPVRATTPKQRNFQPSTHLRGVPGVSFRVCGTALSRAPEALEAAQRAAELDAADVGIAILRRRGRPIGEAMAILSARDLARLLALAVEPTDDAADVTAAVVSKRP